MTDYDSDSSDGREQPRMVEVSAAEWERMQAELRNTIRRLDAEQKQRMLSDEYVADCKAQLAAARAALEAVEWVYDDVSKYCPWCRAMTHHANRPIKHKPDCPRQAALAAMEEKL